MTEYKKNNRRTGSAYEQKAAAYLESLGYQVLEKNFYCRAGEIDLIAAEGGFLVFIEVKYRNNLACGTPQEAVDHRKQRRICRAAAFYCLKHGLGETFPCRFDVAAFTGGSWTIIRNAFDYLP